MTSSISHSVRLPAVAGRFYADDPQTLQSQLQQAFQMAKQQSAACPKVIVAPHAGYIYSGAVAASAYQLLKNCPQNISRVVVLSPAHRYGFHGIACSDADYFRTPLGDIPVDQESLQQLIAEKHIFLLEQAFDGEHALEVHLPFLQSCLAEFSLIPLIVGQTATEKVARLIDALWGDKDTLIVISSDLSHFHDYQTAGRIDRTTANMIEKLDYALLSSERACGVFPLRGLLQSLQNRQLQIRNIDLRNSGDSAGSKDSVVGYGAFIVEENHYAG